MGPDGSSMRISEIVRVIDELGYQASLLALSAAVDAAPAIDAGLDAATAAAASDGAAAQEALAAHARHLCGIVERIRALALDQGRALPAAAARRTAVPIHLAPPSSADIAALAGSLQCAGAAAPTPYPDPGLQTIPVARKRTRRTPPG